MLRTSLKTALTAAVLLATAACHQQTARENPVIAPNHAVHAPATRPADKTFVNARAIILLRHADIDINQKRSMGDAVPLLPRGEQRAKELAYALKDAGVTRIITSEALRTKATAAVLAEQLHLTPETPFQHGAYMQGDHVKAENSTVYEYLAENARPSDVILVVHHHSVLPGVLAQFGFPSEPHYDDPTEFDRAYVILPDAEHHTYHLLRLRYGGDWHQGK